MPTSATSRGRSTTSESKRSLPLSGLRVLDLTLARAGPTAVRHLADWGADVIRIDNPPPPPGSAAAEDIVGRVRGSDYQNLHRNKRSMRLNLKTPDGKAVFLDLVKTADVLVENMRPAVKERLGIGYEDLKAVNPRLIYGSISGFGQTGPYRDRPGVDQIAQGMSGLMSVTGLPDGVPMRAGIAVGDLTAGNLMALSIMMALYERERTGEGRWVHTSLMESLLFMMDFQAVRWLVDKEVPKRVGNEHPTRIPTDVFATSDGHVTICAASSRLWGKFCKAIERPEWEFKPEWLTGEMRKALRAEVHREVGKVLLMKSTRYWLDNLNAAGVPCGPVYTVDQAFADEQVQHLDMRLPVEHPSLGPMDLLASPLNFDGIEQTVRRTTPDQGANVEEILSELGYGADRIAALRANGIC